MPLSRASGIFDGSRSTRFERELFGATSVVTLAVLLLLGREARAGRIPGWDFRVWRSLHGDEVRERGSDLDRVANALLSNGGRAAIVILGLVALALLLRARRFRDAAFLVLTSGAVAGLTPLLKELFERPATKYAFPSGHAADSAAIVAAVVVTAWSTRWRWPTLAGGLGLTAALGLALVYENWHLPSDVIGGWCLAVACGSVARVVVTATSRAGLEQ